jgi:hypothetical protein
MKHALSAKLVFCECNGNHCPCGKNGAEILRCKKPIPLARVSQIMSELAEQVKAKETLQ